MKRFTALLATLAFSLGIGLAVPQTFAQAPAPKEDKKGETTDKKGDKTEKKSEKKKKADKKDKKDKTDKGDKADKKEEKKEPAAPWGATDPSVAP